MRITNSMISGGMLLNMNRNLTGVNNYYTQLSTGKRIQVPSDDPISSSRALKFRTNVAETEQYMKNVSQGLSWMEVTEAAFTNVNNIMFSIRELSARGASDTLTYEDREKILKEISQLTDQIGLEMNATYGGRYVFSGYRTDQPPVIAEDDKDLSFTGITQHFEAGDVQKTLGYHRGAYDPSTDKSKNDEVSVIKLAYTDLKVPIEFFDAAGNSLGTAKPISIDDKDAYKHGNYIIETGEYILHDNMKMPVSVTYNKEGFKKGELNPMIYFRCVDSTEGSATKGKVFNADIAEQHQSLEYEFSVNTRVRINSNAPDVFTDKLYADLRAIVNVSDYMNGMSKDQITDALREQGLDGEVLEDAVAKEMQYLQEAFQDRFSDMLSMMDKYISDVSVEYTDLGSRMNRLDLINTRLSDDLTNYTKLMSDNEDVNYAEAIMKLNSLESVYQASLKVSGSIMKLTLADFV